ncbi:MAG: amidohydrolase family protein [Candidatus Aminicenantes bacterium]|jgi:hypothetical protein
MFYPKGNIRYVYIIILFTIFFGAAINCKENSTTTFDRLRAYIDTIRVINTHEHQHEPADYAGQKYTFYTILANAYLRADLVSAGAPAFKPDVLNQSSLDELWGMYGPYLDFSRNTSYYNHFLTGIRILYGFNEPYFTKKRIATLSEEIAENYNNREAWYKKAVEKAGFDIMLLDQYWDNFNVDIDTRYFALVFNINSLVSMISARSEVDFYKDSVLKDPFELATKEGFSIKNIDDYLAFADHMMTKFLAHKAVSLKNTLAYSRAIHFQDVPYEKANELFERSPETLSTAEKKALQDFMFHWIINKSIEVDLPIQIHTGYLAGNANTLENSRPTLLNNLFLKYPKARFVIFHGGYPWTGEFAALGKMFPNVYLDLVWLPQISREAAVRALDEMLDCVPYNKFFWGGDCGFIEESVGSLEFGKDVVARVLAARVDRGLMTEDVACDVALKIFRENALRFFKLEEKLDREF